MTLDDQVPVEHDVGDFAVDQPRASQLIGFLKALEFTSFTKKVAGELDADMAAIEPCRWRSSSGRRRAARTWRMRTKAEAPARPPRSAPKAETVPPAPSASDDALKAIPFRHADYETVTDLAALDGWIAEANDQGLSSPSTPRPMRWIRCRPIWSACRWPPHPARPATSRWATRPRAAGSSAAMRCAGQIERQGSTRPPQAAARGSVGPQDRPEPQIRHRGAGAVRHRRRADRRHHADLLRPRIGRCAAMAWTSSPSAISATSRSASRRWPGSGKSAISFDRVPLAAPPTMRRRTPT